MTEKKPGPRALPFKPKGRRVPVGKPAQPATFVHTVPGDPGAVTIAIRSAVETRVLICDEPTLHVVWRVTFPAQGAWFECSVGGAFRIDGKTFETMSDEETRVRVNELAFEHWKIVGNGLLAAAEASSPDPAAPPPVKAHGVSHVLGLLGIGATSEPDLTITIPGEPFLWPRARARVVHGKFAKFFLPREYTSWKALATTYIEQAVGEARLDLVETEGRHLVFPTGPVRVDVTAIFSCPKGDYRKDPRPRRWHDKRDDRDNVDKAVLDCLTGIVVRDDGQVAAGIIQKFIGAQGEAPHTIVRIWRLT